MIKINGLSKYYGGQVIFEDINFAMSSCERLGLVGRNGTGKTTLFKIILGEEEPDSGSVTMPRYYKIGHLSQHLKFTEDTVLKEAVTNLPKSEDGIDETYKAEEILMGLGLTEDYFGQDPLNLSGGYQIRLNLAKVLVSNPNLLLLDEPTNYLDIVSIRWLQRFLQNWRGELMLITHDREFMDSVTTHTMAIHRAKLKKVTGTTDKLYAQILQEEEIYEQTRQNDEKKRAEIEKFVNRFRAKATKASAVQSRIKALDRMGKMEKLDNIRSLEFEFNSAPFLGKWLVEADNISFGYSGAQLIKGLSFPVGKEDRIAIIGKNGKGKTTLLNLLAGELEPASGAVKHHPNLKIAYFGQTNIGRLDLRKTVEQEIMDAHPDYSRGASRRIAGAMMFDGDKALKKIEVLSGGERARVLLGKLLVSPANLLLLDEPTNHLDMDSIDSLIEAIDAFDGAVVIVTHSELILRSTVNRLVVFDGGVVDTFDGTYDEFLEKVGWEGESDSGRAKPRAEKSMNKKEARKLRADVLAEKFRVLGPLQKQIKGMEDTIVELEKTAEAHSHELLLASERAEPDLITKLSRSYHEGRAMIDELFDKLEALMSEHDEKEKEFEERLGRIG